MKRILLASFTVCLSALPALAGVSMSVAPESSSGAEGALILLLLVGAVVLLSGRGGAAKAPLSTQSDQDDSDIIMKF